MLRPRHRRRGQQEVFQHVSSLTAGKRLTTEATPYVALDDLSPMGNFDDVIKRLALRTVEERPILHSQRPRLGKRRRNQAASM